MAEADGRITGYLEDVPGDRGRGWTAVMEGSVDGRKLAGLRRRLETLVESPRVPPARDDMDADRQSKLLEAAGVFEATADALGV